MRTIILLLTLAIGTTSVYSQEVPKPDFPKRPYYLENGELKSLPKETPKQKGVYSTKYVVKEKSSEVTFDAGKNIEFIFEYSGEQDIEGLFSVVIGDVSRKGRTFKAGGYKAFGGKSKDNSENELPFEVKRVDAGIYKMIVTDVGSGQYAVIPQRDASSLLSAGSKVFIYTFGVQ